MKKIFTLLLVSILLIAAIALTSCKETPVETTTPDPVHVHEYSDELVPQNCTHSGYTKHTCECGYTYYDAFVNPDSITHGFVVVETVDATCTNYGYVKSACQWCHKESSEVIAPSHKLGEWAVYTEETCTESGEERLSCSACDYYESREIPAHHFWGEGTVTAPKCEDQGYTTYFCTKCTESENREFVDATGHTLSDWAVVEGKEVTCLVDGEEERHCTTDGCDYAETNVIEAHHLDANTVLEVTPPKCTEVGYTEYTCSVEGCEFSRIGNYTSPAHDFDDWTTIKEATETTEGLESRTCKADGCGAVETRIVPVTQPEATTPPSNEEEE